MKKRSSGRSLDDWRVEAVGQGGQSLVAWRLWLRAFTSGEGKNCEDWDVGRLAN